MAGIERTPEEVAEFKRQLREALEYAEKNAKPWPRPMPPPWTYRPDIPRSSIGWRMGSGEDFMIEFHNWFGSLSPDERSAFQHSNPEPENWSGWYEMLEGRF